MESYRRRFVPPLKTGAGSLIERCGWILREVREGLTYFGEVAPFPGFSDGSENVESTIHRWQREEDASLLGEMGVLGFAGWCLNQPLPFAVKVPSAALLHGNSEENREWIPGSTVKVKVGIQSGEAERDRIDQMVKAMPESVTVRLDANQRLNLESTGEWLKWVRERPQIEFLEQPMARGAERQLMDSFPEDIERLALDESVVSLPSLMEVLSLGWEGWLVVKPSLFGSPEPLFSLPEAVRRKLIVSSAFETGVGFSFVLEVARRLGDFGIAHGLGTRGAFGDDGLDGWAASLQFEGSVTADLLEGVRKNAS